MTQRDLYDILGVDRKATAAEIKSAYRKLAMKWHPDKNKSAEAPAKFKEIGEAYEVLSSSDKRAQYDRYGHQSFSGGGGPNPFAQGGFSSQGFQGNINLEDLFGNFSDPFDVFGSFFGQSGFGQQSRRSHYSLKISFMDAINGKQVSLKHDGKTYDIKIPAGIDEGTRIRYQEFDVSVDILPDPRFHREGQDVIVDTQIPLSLSVLGGEHIIDTLEGSLKIRIKQGTQPGSVLRLSGQGVKYPNSSRRGDLYIRIGIRVPERLSRAQRDLFEQLKDQNL
jgi:curved DNA-binding protein